MIIILIKQCIEHSFRKTQIHKFVTPTSSLKIMGSFLMEEKMICQELFSETAATQGQNNSILMIRSLKCNF